MNGGYATKHPIVYWNKIDSFILFLDKLFNMSKMILPDDVLGIIRAFAKPIGTRLDWRTCKRNESRRIKGSNKALSLWYKWFIGDSPLNAEVQSWSFYGRRHLVHESRLRFWTMVLPEDPQNQDPEFYEKRFLLFNEMPRMVANGSTCEYYMGDVSIIV
jgi:hypothetical protein